MVPRMEPGFRFIEPPEPLVVKKIVETRIGFRGAGTS